MAFKAKITNQDHIEEWVEHLNERKETIDSIEIEQVDNNSPQALVAEENTTLIIKLNPRFIKGWGMT